MIGNKEKQVGEKDKFSLWLKPEGEIYDILKRIIDSLADAHDAPRFEPHVTIAGTDMDPGDMQTMQNLLSQIASDCEPMTLYLKGTDFRESFFRSLFIHIAPNDALFALRNKCLGLLNQEHTPFMPHISLMYKEMDQEIKCQILEQVGKRFDLAFIPDKIHLVRTTGQPESWKEVMHVPLKF